MGKDKGKDTKRRRSNATDPKKTAQDQATGSGSRSSPLPPPPSKDQLDEVSFADAAKGLGTSSQPASRPATPPPQDTTAVSTGRPLIPHPDATAADQSETGQSEG